MRKCTKSLSSLRENVVIDNFLVNDNVCRFYEFTNKRSLSALNTWFSHKVSQSDLALARSSHQEVYDFILACSWLRQYVSNCIYIICVYNSYDFDPDHRIVIADTHHIHRMANNLWTNLDLHNVWGNSRLKTLWKGKGSKSDPSKYRGLSISSTICKLFVNIILERIRPWYEAQLSEEQNGFRKDRHNGWDIHS